MDIALTPDIKAAKLPSPLSLEVGGSSNEAEDMIRQFLRASAVAFAVMTASGVAPAGADDSLWLAREHLADMYEVVQGMIDYAGVLKSSPELENSNELNDFMGNLAELVSILDEVANQFQRFERCKTRLDSGYSEEIYVLCMRRSQELQRSMSHMQERFHALEHTLELARKRTTKSVDD